MQVAVARMEDVGAAQPVLFESSPMRVSTRLNAARGIEPSMQ
jgi:hypothetical protein